MAKVLRIAQIKTLELPSSEPHSADGHGTRPDTRGFEMTANRRRKQDARELAASDGITYTAALRQQAATSQSGLGILNDTTPPADWNPLDHLPSLVVLAILRDRDEHGIGDELAVFDRAGNRLAEMTVPHVPTEQLMAEYADEFAAFHVEGSPAHLQLECVVRLGRPDLLFHRLGYDARALADWQQWSDGSHRSLGKISDYTHSVTLTPLDVEDGEMPRVRIVVTEHPNTVVLDHIHTGLTTKSGTHEGNSDQAKLRRYVDEYGYAVENYWTELPRGALYGRANAGHLAERDWWRKAKVRMLRTVKCGSPGALGEPPHVYHLGEIVEMHQSGRAGREVRRVDWWSSTDIDYAYIIDAEDAEIVEILEDRLPFWAEAALSAEQVTALLTPHHPNAAEAAAAWEAAGLLVTEDVDGLIIRTPAPERRRLGRIRRDYWQKNRHVKPYEVITDPNDSMWASGTKLDTLPLDPRAAAGLSTPGAGRTVYVDHLGDEACDMDRLRDGLHSREGQWAVPAECVLTDAENWNYNQVAQIWQEHVAERLAPCGITWKPDADTAVLPVGMSDEQAAAFWAAATDGFDPWLDQIVTETRRGKPAHDEDIRDEDAPGGVWIVPSVRD